MERKIIIGYDGSPNGRDGLELGRLLAEVLAAKALVCDAAPFPHGPHGLGEPDQLHAALREATDVPLRHANEVLAGVEVEPRPVLDPSPARALFQLAETERPLLVAIGSSHRGALGRVFLGSVGQRLVEGLSCALAIAPHGYATRRETHLQRIGAGIDESTESRAALHTAIGLAERTHGRLHLIGVESLSRIASAWAPGMAAPDLRAIEQAQASRALRDATEQVPADLPVQTVKPAGDPAECLARASKDLDLLAVGSRSYGPMHRLFLGSVTARLMHNARCPLLILPRDAGEDPLGLGMTEPDLAEAS